MSSSNRELVIDFVSYKLSQKGYSWSQLEEEDENRTDFAAEEAEMDGVLNGSPSWHPPASHVVNGAAMHRSSLEVHEIVQTADVRQALREAGDEFELRYRRAFSDLTSQLHITPGTAYQSFEQVVNELFRDGVNWGRIVAFFSFGGALCVESVDKEMRVLVGRVVSWMTTYLTDHLDPWIQENGGWSRPWPLSPALSHTSLRGRGAVAVCRAVALLKFARLLLLLEMKDWRQPAWTSRAGVTAFLARPRAWPALPKPRERPEFHDPECLPSP
uniref:Bcl-2-like protein 1 n=1 Tax=Buteo japonicus TaxID=224669 RepID=A0A8C0AZ41_9AVES